MKEKFASIVGKVILCLVIFSIIIAIVCGFIYKYRVDPIQLQSKFFNSYNELNDAYRLMKSKNMDFENIQNPNSYIKKFAGYFKLESLCSDFSEPCLWNNFTYKTLDGGIIPVYYGRPNVGQFITRSGALFMIYEEDDSIRIYIDTNGIYRKPNRFGLDLFAFYIKDNKTGLQVMGDKNTPYRNISFFCNPYVSNKYNGMACPFKAIYDNNFFENTIKILY